MSREEDLDPSYTHRALELLGQHVSAGNLDQALTLPLLKLLDVVLLEAQRTPRFQRALVAALQPPAHGSAEAEEDKGRPRGGRRAPSVVDPYALLEAGGSEGLRSALDGLSVEQLKDVIAQHGMDRDRLAMKWKDRARLIDRIVTTVDSRASKGDAFRRDGVPDTESVAAE